VSIAPFVRVYQRVRDVFRIEPDKAMTKRQVMQAIRDRFLQVVEDNWSPDLFHVVLHSGGYDSRILSWAIWELTKKNGPDWLDPGIMFLCTPREGEQLEAVMQHEGWGDDQYAVVGQETFDQLRFRSAWERLGGPFGVPVNLFWYTVEQAQRWGMVPASDRVQMWSGYTANETLEYLRLHKSLSGAYHAMYYGPMFQRAFNAAQTVFPFSDVGIAGIGKTFVWLGLKRFDLLRFLAPGLAALERGNTSGDLGQRISPAAVAQAVVDVRNSWYAKAVGQRIAPPRSIRVVAADRFWSHWSAASLCQHLLEQGHEIKVG
jgi:hypothetical protein